MAERRVNLFIPLLHILVIVGMELMTCDKDTTREKRRNSNNNHHPNTHPPK